MPSSNGLNQLKTLLVDDNQHMRTLLAAILSGAGLVQNRECANGAEALEALRVWPADIVITDYRMSPVNGIEFTRLVRNAPDSPNPFVPIIMVTADAERHIVFEARDAGVTEFATKPVSARIVLDRLNNIIFRPRPFIKSPGYFGPDRRQGP